MPTLHLLGTGAALADASRTTTMVAVEGRSVIVIDCGADVVQRLLVAGIELDAVRLLILTHEHADHVCGFPLFMEKIWLARRRRPIPVRGPHAAVEQARTLWESFDTSGWEGVPDIEWQEVALRENAPVWEDDEWRITSAPGEHSVPVIGVRIEELGSGSVMTYSSDTERCGPIARLAAGADILVHEATGDFPGHCSAAAAAELALDARVRQLVLVHIPARFEHDDLGRATAVFPRTELGEDGGRYAF